MEPILAIRNLSKEFAGNIVLKGLDLNIYPSEFITLLGPSGCGKTTLLRLIAGFEKPNSGEILFENKPFIKVPVHKRPVNTIFQNYALFPHLNVFENIAYGLRLKHLSKYTIKQQVRRALVLVNLAGFEDKEIDTLSGGQKQRVAIARALVNRPKILLLDEPLAALDKNLRTQMQIELKRIQQEVGITFIFVTHDQEEALTLSNRIVVLNQGKIEQVGTPEEIYNEPESKWVAKFVGASNIIEDGLFVTDYMVKIDGHKLNCLDRGFGKQESNIDIVIRPEDIQITAPGGGYFNGTITSAVFKGIHWEITVKTRKRNYLVHATKYAAPTTRVGLTWDQDAIHVMWKEIDEKAKPMML